MSNTDIIIAEGYSRKESEDLAKSWVAEAGKSEHELGIALDINADTYFCSDAEVYDWLYENAYKYGFILRYPQNKENITGIDYEPWQVRVFAFNYIQNLIQYILLVIKHRKFIDFLPQMQI